MMTTDLMNGGVKVAKMAGSVLISAAIVEVGYLGGKMFGNDAKFIANEIDKKVNPIEYRKEHWYSKKKPYNTRTGKYVK